MHVEVPLRVRTVVSRRLMNARRVREGNIEKIVVPRRHGTDNIGKVGPLLFFHLRQASDMPPAHDEHFKRPDRPVRDKSGKAVVLDDNPLAFFVLDLQVIREETSSFRPEVRPQALPFVSRLVRNGILCPNLTVRMGIAAPHHLPFVLKDLNVIDEGNAAQPLILFRPDINHAPDLITPHLRKRQIMTGRETDHPAHAPFSPRDQQIAGAMLRLGRIGQEGTEIVVKDERGGIGWVALVSCPEVSRTEIAGGIIRRAVFLRRSLNLSLPWPPRAMW